MDYIEFLKSKDNITPSTGLAEPVELSPVLFDFQRDIVGWALKRGRAAIFAGCGMGKTFMQLEWGKHVPGRVLVLAPLAVAAQTVEEGKKLGIDIKYTREQTEDGKILITNYEMLDHFDPDEFTGIVLDESSILKSFNGKFRTRIIEAFKSTRFKLACTATPAPNDYMELGNHAEFLGVMSRTEMLATYFVHDCDSTQEWRLKGHAEEDFWKWMCSWSIMIRKPSDLGYEDKGFDLPPLKIHQITVESEATPGFLFAMEAKTLTDRLQARRNSIDERVNACADLVNQHPEEPWLVWCNLNNESNKVSKLINAVEVQGSDKQEAKEDRLMGFTNGKYKRLVSKASIAGFGMNWQHCRKMAFVGLSDSWEQFYQAVRRCYRFGQTKPVDVYLITAEAEGAVIANIKRKEDDAAKMAERMVKYMSDITSAEIKGQTRQKDAYIPSQKIEIPSFI